MNNFFCLFGATMSMAAASAYLSDSPELIMFGAVFGLLAGVGLNSLDEEES